MAHRNREKSKMGIVLVIFISLIMVSSIAGFLIVNQPSDISRFKGSKFVRQQNTWVATVNGNRIFFDYQPQAIASLNASKEFLPLIRGKVEIDTTSDINDSYSSDIALAQYNLGVNLNALGVFVRQGLTANNTYQLPVITCEDATPLTPVIYFRKGEDYSQIIEDGCLTISLRSRDEVHAIKDMILLGVLGLLE
ncbi:hypothetical protein HYU13_00925 [Candidatus Woesearchaeota archaeon]|nr:hypothetical protein [Candidatus Woesearchaeota archaeon]